MENSQILRPYETGSQQQKFQPRIGPQSQKISDRYQMNGSPWALLFIPNHSNHAKLTSESSLQLGTAKLFAYAELIKSEFNKISEIFPIFINLTSFSRFAVMILKLM